MLFILTVFLVAFSLETYGSYISILGLAKNSSYMLIILAILLDVSKIVIATILYKNWKKLHFLTKLYLLPGLLILMLFTSSGSYAYLMQEFSKTTINQETIVAKLDLLKNEQTRLLTRKKEIDSQISNLDPNMVTQKKRLIQMFDSEISKINPRLEQLEKEIPELTTSSMQSISDGGTLGTIAKAYNIKPEQISKVLVFLLVLFIDPLAIILLTIGNYLIDERRKERNTLPVPINKPNEEDIILDNNFIFPKIKIDTKIVFKELLIDVNDKNQIENHCIDVEDKSKENESSVNHLEQPIINFSLQNEQREIKHAKVTQLAFPKKQAGKINLSMQKRQINFI